MICKHKPIRISVFLLIFYFLLFQTAYATNEVTDKKPSFCQLQFIEKIKAVSGITKSYLKKPAHSLKKGINSVLERRYIQWPVLDQNDFHSIHQALSTTQSDGAAIIDIRPFTPELAEKIRKAILLAKPRSYHRGYFIENSEKLTFEGFRYEEDWETFKKWLLSKTQIISSEDIDQFRQEVDEFLSEIKQAILKADGQDIKLSYFVIRASRVHHFDLPHSHGVYSNLDKYLTATIAPVGLSTYYYHTNRKGNRWLPKKIKVFSPSGHAIIMAETTRAEHFSENRDLVVHGPPSSLNPRLFLISLFRKAQ